MLSDKPFNHDAGSDVPPESLVDHVRNSVKEIFGGSNSSTYEKVAIGTGVLIAGAVGLRFGLSRFFGAAEEGLLSESAIARSSLSSDVAAASEISAQKAVPELSALSAKELEPNFRYFQQTRVARPNIYRWPANGKPLEEQSLSDVERYVGNGKWQNSQRNRLLDEKLKGWFDDNQDEVTGKRASELISKIFKK